MAKDEYIKFRVNAQEKKDITEKAQESGFDNTSDYLRFLLSKSENKKAIFSQGKRKKPIDNGLYDQLKRIGNNLNQVAYNINVANLSDKVNDELAKQVVKELMYLNIQVGIAIDNETKKGNL